MADYGTFCPIAKAAAVLGERWTILILRELMYGNTRFNRLERGIPGISRAILAKRLRTLLEAGIISTDSMPGAEPGYFLTRQGEELLPLLVGIGEWGQRWLNQETRPEDIDADYLVWDIHRRINLDALPGQRFVVEVQFEGLSSNLYWLVIEFGKADVSLDPPKARSDLMMEADTFVLHEVWLGRRDISRELSRDAIRIHGPPRKAEAFIQSLQYNAFASLDDNGGSPVRR